MKAQTLERSFFERGPDKVAAELIGSLIVVRDETGERVARLVETEAYGGSDDPASHSYRGLTKRNAVMFGPAGYLYVYLIYGVHWCANVVTECEGTPSAVLLRAAELVTVDEEPWDPRVLLRGPGNLTRGLGLAGDDDGEDCCAGPSSRVSFRRDPEDAGEGLLGRSIRVGLTKGRERPSRYFLEGHAAVTRAPKPL